MGGGSHRDKDDSKALDKGGAVSAIIQNLEAVNGWPVGNTHLQKVFNYVVLIKGCFQGQDRLLGQMEGKK